MKAKPFDNFDECIEYYREDAEKIDLMQYEPRVHEIYCFKKAKIMNPFSIEEKNSTLEDIKKAVLSCRDYILKNMGKDYTQPTGRSYSNLECHVKMYNLYFDLFQMYSDKSDFKPIVNTKNIDLQLEDFIFNVSDKNSFIEDLKTYFNYEKGKAIKSIMTILTDENILVIGGGKKAKFIRALEKEFNRDIGTYQSINDVDLDEMDLIPIKAKLEPIIKRHKTPSESTH